MHLSQPEFIYNACRPLTDKTEQIQKFKERGDARCIHENKSNKWCFQHDAAYSSYEYLARRAASDKVLRDNAFKINSNPQEGSKRGLVSKAYKCFDEKSKENWLKLNSDIFHQVFS